MNFRQIEAFRAVMTTGSVTEAGNMLCVTQPAVTRLIINLEHDVGFKLFDRTRNRLVPTAEGKRLHAEVERSFAGMEKIAHAARAIRNMESGRVSVLVTPMMAYGILPRIIGMFHEDFPEIYVELMVAPRDLLIERIASQLHDVAIETPPIRDPAITETVLTRRSALCVLPAEHPLARRKTIHAADLQDERFVSLPLSAMFRTKTDELFRQEGIERKLTAETDTQLSACSLVAAGVGLSIVGPYVIDDTKGQPIVFRPFEPAIAVEYALLYPSLRPASAITAKFVEYVERYFEKEFGKDSG